MAERRPPRAFRPRPDTAQLQRETNHVEYSSLRTGMAGIGLVGEVFALLGGHWLALAALPLFALSWVAFTRAERRYTPNIGREYLGTTLREGGWLLAGAVLGVAGVAVIVLLIKLQ